MGKITIEIDLETFKHALRNLTKREIFLILQQYDYNIDAKLSKSDVIDNLTRQALNNKITGEMYYTFREKAFSVDNNFYDGFFYKIDELYGDFSIDSLYRQLIIKANNSKYDEKIIINLFNKDNESMKFNFERSKKRDYYDYDSETSRAYKQLLSASVEVYRKLGLVYIHSKNLTDSKIIKTFLDKCFIQTSTIIDKRKKVLSEPEFKINVADAWYKKSIKQNKYKINPITLHMLDLFFEFESDRSYFSNVRMKSIYLKENTLYIGNNEARITDLRCGGINLQGHKKIIEEIINGKRILGFKLEVEYMYEDEETEEKVPTVLPITILYEDKNYLRISISSDCLTTQKQDVLRQAYDSAKSIFVNKYVSNSIVNSDKLIEYLTEIFDQEINVRVQNNSDTDKKGKNSQLKWSF